MLVRTAPRAGDPPAMPLGGRGAFAQFVKLGSLVTPRCTVTASYAPCSCPFEGIGTGPGWDPLLFGGVAVAGAIAAPAADVVGRLPPAIAAFGVPGVCAIIVAGLSLLARSGCPGVASIGVCGAAAFIGRGVAVLPEF